MSEPVDRSTHWPYERGEVGAFFYQRYGNPTVAAAEAELGALDGGTALLFPSGAGATTAIVAAPDPAWLLLRGLKTLEVRVRRQTETARILAKRLDDHWAVATVRYPGFGGLLSFDVDDAEKARQVETSTRVIVNATSLG